MEVLFYYILDNILTIILMIVFMMSAAFFTGSEVALVSCDRLLMSKMSRKNNLGAKRAVAILRNIESLLTVTQVGTNASIAAVTTLLTLLLMNYSQRGDFSSTYGVVLFTPFILLFCDTLPKMIARNYSQAISVRVAWIIDALSRFLLPVIRFIALYTRFVEKILYGKEVEELEKKRKKAREDIYRLFSKGEKDISIQENQKRMISKILEFPQKTAKVATIPLVQVDMIEEGQHVDIAIDLFHEYRYSRMPVYSERVDNVVGVLDIRDIFFVKDKKEAVRKYMRPASFIPEYQELCSLIQEMKKPSFPPLAIVVDEYGGATGILTKEDLAEEVVGDLFDEFDDYEMMFSRISEKSYLVQGNIPIDEFNERVEAHIPKKEYETLSGFLLQEFNKIPAAEDELYYADIHFRIFRANETSIQSVIVTKI